jgi:hypothetical protein
VGDYFFGDIKSWIKIYNPRTGAVTSFATGLRPVLDALAVGADGSLYALTRGSGTRTGVLVRIALRSRHR